MRNAKSKQKVILAGLLMTLLAFNISWNEFLGFNFTNSDDFASRGVVLSESQEDSITEKAKAACKKPESRAREEARTLMDTGSLTASHKYEHEYEKDGDEVKETKTFYSSSDSGIVDLKVCKNGLRYKTSSSRFNCSEQDIDPERKILKYSVTVRMSKSELHGTEGRAQRTCDGNCGPTILDSIDVSEDTEKLTTFELNLANRFGDKKDRDLLEREFCELFHKHRSVQYREMSLGLKALAEEDEELEKLNDKLDELKEECKVDSSVDGKDVWKAVGKDHSDNMKHLKELSGIDFLTGSTADDDLEDLAEAIALTDKEDILRCHRRQVRSKEGKEAKAEYVHKMLKDYREMMVSDDEDIRKLAYDQVDFLRSKKYGLNRNMRRFLKGEKLRGEATHNYQKRIDKINAHFDKQLDRIDEGTADGRLQADYVRENRRLAKLQAKSHYTESVQRTFNGWPKSNDDVLASADFWDDHVDDVINGTDDDGSLFDGSSVEDLDFAGRFDPDTYRRDSARTGRWDDRIGFRLDAFNNESRRIDFGREIADTLDSFRRGLDGLSPMRDSSSRFSNLGNANRFAPPSSSSFRDANLRGRGLVRDRDLRDRDYNRDYDRRRLRRL